MISTVMGAQVSTAASTAEKKKISTAALAVAAAGATLGLIYGYDNGNIGGAQIFFGPDLHLNTEQVETVTSAIVWGEIIGALCGGWVSNRIGRKKTIVLIAAGYLVFCATSAFSFNELTLWSSRFFLGVTVGLSLIAVPLFVAESVPARVRGSALVLYQVMGVTGILLGNLISAALTHANPAYNWRIMLGLAALPALILLPMLLRLPETPNWLMIKGRREEAVAAQRQIAPDEDTEAEIADMEAALREESGGSITEMLRKPYLRATMFVVVLGFFIQITGINSTVTYGPQLFKSMGFSGNTGPILASAAIQVFALASVLVSMRYIDRWGRRPILLTGISVMAAGLLITAINFATISGDFSAVQQVVGFAGLAIVQIGFVFGFGSLVWVYASEAFPGRLRAFGTSALLTADLIANLIVAQFTLTLLDTIGGTGTFVAFAVLCVLAILFVAKFAPETKGRQLDEIRHYWENNGKWPEKQTAQAGSGDGSKSES